MPEEQKTEIRERRQASRLHALRPRVPDRPNAFPLHNVRQSSPARCALSRRQPTGKLFIIEGRQRAEALPGLSVPDPGGARRDRTDDLMLAKHALSQLSYGRRAEDGYSSARPPGGARRDRTDDLMLAKHALSQLSYSPVREQKQTPEAQMTDATSSVGDFRAGIRRLKMVGLGGLEPPTSRLSSARSNQLSYKPELSRARKGSPPSNWKEKRDEDGGVPPMRPLTKAADSKTEDKTGRPRGRASARPLLSSDPERR